MQTRFNRELTKLTPITPELIEHVCRQIITTINPRRIVLFGSQARGDAEAGSDLDLLMVHDSALSDRQLRRQLERLFLPRRFSLDLIVRTTEEVAKNLADNNPFYARHIFGEGKILYERPDITPPEGIRSAFPPYPSFPLTPSLPWSPPLTSIILACYNNRNVNNQLFLCCSHHHI